MTTTTNSPSVVADGIISGELLPYPARCERCGMRTRVIRLAGVVLPEGVTMKATILHKRGEEDPTLINKIGLGCGCYAKFHRQLVHIRGNH